MATYRKLLKNRAGDTIIPVVGETRFDITEFTGTRCSGYVVRSNNFGFIIGTTTSFTYTGTYQSVTCVIPANTVPSGTKAINVQATTCAHTVDDNQWTHGSSGFTFSTNAYTLQFALLSGIATSKSCQIAFLIPVIFPD